MIATRKATKFSVTWDDGTIWTAEGEAAASVMEWYQACEGMNCIHGAVYAGPQITITHDTVPTDTLPLHPVQ